MVSMSEMCCRRMGVGRSRVAEPDMIPHAADRGV